MFSKVILEGNHGNQLVSSSIKAGEISKIFKGQEWPFDVSYHPEDFLEKFAHSYGGKYAIFLKNIEKVLPLKDIILPTPEELNDAPASYSSRSNYALGLTFVVMGGFIDKLRINQSNFNEKLRQILSICHYNYDWENPENLARELNKIIEQ